MTRKHTTSALARRTWLGASVLLAAALVAIPHMDDVAFRYDELWAVMHSMGSWRQIVTDPDLLWPPGYYFVLHTWIALVSFHDFAVRALNVYLGLVSVALMIRAGRELHSERAGWLAGLLYATNVFAAYFRLEARGYSLMLLGFPLVWWAHARWSKEPTWRRAVPYSLAQALLFYAQSTNALITPLFLGVHVLLSAPRRLWRWILVMLGAIVLAAPIVPQYYHIYTILFRFYKNVDNAMIVHSAQDFYQAYSSHKNIAWAIVLGLAAWGLFRAGRHNRRFAISALVLVVWGAGVPFYAYCDCHKSGICNLRYLLFTVPPLLLVLGLGLAQLPSRVMWVGVVLIAYIALSPWHIFDYRAHYMYGDYPVRDLLRYFATHFKPGDTLVVDPAVESPFGLDWWYYEKIYYPLGIPRAKDGYEAGPRVWHLVRQGAEDPELLRSVQEGRLRTGEFWGPWYYIATLYEGPPLSSGFRFGDSIHFRGADIPSGVLYRPGETLVVRTWWSVDAPPEADYAIGVYVISPQGELVAQNDNGPTGRFSGGRTSAWQPGEVYLDERTITIPKGWDIDKYDVIVAVYQWWDNRRLPVSEGDPRDYRERSTVSIGTIHITTYDTVAIHQREQGKH